MTTIFRKRKIFKTGRKRTSRKRRTTRNVVRALMKPEIKVFTNN